MNRECKSAKKCEICGFEVHGQGSVRHHVNNVHKISMAEYREKYNVPKLTTAKFTNIQTEVTCRICGDKRMRPTHLVEAYKARGIIDHTCGKPACAKQLRAIKVKAARSTDQSRANTSAASIKSWAKNHDEHVAACQAGMAISPNCSKEARVPKLLETRRIAKLVNPNKYSIAVKNSWDTRGRSEWETLEFDCDNCGTHVARLLPPASFKAKAAQKHHFCIPYCQKEYNSLHTKFRDTKIELMVGAYLAAQEIPALPQQLIKFRKDFGIRKWTVVDFLVGAKLVIYVDGCYFHGCKQCGFPGLKDNATKDPLITAELQRMGYTVLRIWEHELKSSAWQSKLLSAVGR